MFLQMAILLAVTSILLEGLVAYRITFYRHIMQSAEWLSVIVSMTLSYIIGKLFGAQGLICLMAGIMSTCASPFMYKALNYADENRVALRDKVTRGQELVHDLVRLTIFVLKVVTAPLWITRRVLVFFNNLSTTIKEV